MNLKIILNKVILFGICSFALTMFTICNFEILLLFYKLIQYILIHKLYTFVELNLINLLHMIYFFIFTCLIAFVLFLISGILAILICFFRMYNLYSIFYAMNNISNILFAPFIIFIIYIYKIPIFIALIFTIFDTISNFVVLTYEYFKLEMKSNMLMLNQFTNSILTTRKFLFYVFYSKFKSLIALYFIEIIDNIYMYAFIIRNTVFLKIIESIICKTSIDNEFIFSYLIFQMFTYLIFSCFTLFSKY